MEIGGESPPIAPKDPPDTLPSGLPFPPLCAGLTAGTAPAPRRPPVPEGERDAPQGNHQGEAGLEVGSGAGLGTRGAYVARHQRTHAHRRDARRVRAEEKLLRGVHEEEPPGEGAGRSGLPGRRNVYGARPLRPAGDAQSPFPQAPLGGRRGGDDGGGGGEGGVENRPVTASEGAQGAGRNRRIALREVRARRRGRGLAVRGEALAGQGAFLRGGSHPLLRVREVRTDPIRRCGGSRTSRVDRYAYKMHTDAYANDAEHRR